MIAQTKKLFEGVRIFDLTWTGVGPTAIKYFAEYGAQVVKVESSLRPDPLRTLPPFVDNKVGLDRSQTYGRKNNNKLSLALNLNHPRAKEVTRRLIEWADVIAEAFAPGAMKRWGLNYEEVVKIKPDIIMMSTSMQGQTGPASSHPGYGYPLTSLSGFTYITGWPDRPPAGAFGPFTDFIAPLYCVVAVVSALDYKRRTGKGQHLDISQYECGLQFLSPMILDYTVNGREFQRRGNRSDCAAPHGVYRCLGDDRWCAIAVFTEEEWRSFCKVIGNPKWCKEHRFATLKDRLKNAGELDKLVETWTVEHTAEEIMALMQAAGVAAGVVENSEDFVNDPQLKHYGAFFTVPHPEMGTCTCQASTVRLTKTPKVEPIRPPLLGEHTELVCKKFLGMPEEQYVSLLLGNVFT